MFTVFIRQSNNQGTTYITSSDATNIEDAKTDALAQCMEDWDVEDEDHIVVIGVAEGDVKILEWDDLED